MNNKRVFLNWEIKRKKENVYTWKDKIVYNTQVNVSNYGVTINMRTKKYWQVFFTINNTDLLELIKQKEQDFIKRQEELNISINNYYDNL